MWLLDIGACNSFVLHKLKFKELYSNDRSRQRWKSLELLAQELIYPFIQERSQKIAECNNRGFNSPILNSIKKATAVLFDKTHSSPRSNYSPCSSFTTPKKVDTKKKACYYCTRENRTIYKAECVECGNKICPEHSKLFCLECFNDKNKNL